MNRWRKVSEMFAPPDSVTRRENDPFQLAETAPRPLLYIYLISNDTEWTWTRNTAIHRELK